MIAVGVPLMILAGVATYFNSRASVARQSPEAAANPQTAMMNKLALYVFPLGVVVGGRSCRSRSSCTGSSNNIWTFGQQHYVFGKIEKEEEAKKLEAHERRAANAPAPGAKPKRPQAKAAALTATAITASCEATDSVGERASTDGDDPVDRHATAKTERRRRRTAAPRTGQRRRAQARGPRSESVDRTRPGE